VDVGPALVGLRFGVGVGGRTMARIL